MRSQRIRVLVVDDSAFARKVIREILSRDPDIEVVGIARDGLEALEKISELKPDVITLDLVMPDLDGIGVLRALPPQEIPKVIVVSSSAADSELAFEALHLGAVDFITKPTPLPTDRLYDLSHSLIAKLKAIALVQTHTSFSSPSVTTVANSLSPLIPKAVVSSPLSPTFESSSSSTLFPNDLTNKTTTNTAETLRVSKRNGLHVNDLIETGSVIRAKLVVIGTSTGGPQALTSLFKELPAHLPVPLAIALHIPEGYTASLAARLTKLGKVPVDEAYDGMELLAGHAVIAPGGKHMRIRESKEKYYAVVTEEPTDLIYRPSVDELFKSAAMAAGSGVVALVMTGMGSDGLEGSQMIRKVGGRVLVESASSCVVYGMPRCVIENDVADFEAPLGRLPGLLVEQIYSPYIWTYS